MNQHNDIADITDITGAAHAVEPAAIAPARPPPDRAIEPKSLPLAHNPADRQAIDVLTQLVSVPSLSGRERPAVELFTRLAASLNLQSSIDAAGNALALRPSLGPERARIILLGHIDTVPGHIPVRIENNTLHARGSVDAKGPLAAMLIAAARATPAEGIALEVIAAVGEETAASPGAHYIRDRRAPAACIIGEPSGFDGVTLGYKGRLRLTLTITGPCGHSAGPDASTADLLTAWWQTILAHVHHLNQGHQGAFDTITASIHSLSSSDNGLHQHARLHAGFRLPTWITPDALQHHIAPPNLPAAFNASLTFEAREHAHASPRNDPVARALSAAIRHHNATPRPKHKTGTSDMNVVAPIWRCPIAAYGPGDSRLDHTPDERLDLAEYLASIHILTDVLHTLSLEIAATHPVSVALHGEQAG